MIRRACARRRNAVDLVGLCDLQVCNASLANFETGIGSGLPNKLCGPSPAQLEFKHEKLVDSFAAGVGRLVMFEEALKCAER